MKTIINQILQHPNCPSDLKYEGYLEKHLNNIVDKANLVEILNKLNNE